MHNTDTIIVTEENAALRLDKLLSSHFLNYSRTYFQYLIAEGFVLVEGSSVKKRQKCAVGDEIEICFVLNQEISVEPEEIPLDILYEDEHLLAINKPAGLVVHPAPGHPNGTFVNALLFHCKNLQGIEDNLRPGIVHRLDKETSGVLLAAKTAETHQKLVTLFSQRQIEKTYLAICVGSPGDLTVNAPIGRHPTKRKEMSINREKGKEAITRFKVLEIKENLTLVEAALITGRTHQIRVHLKHCNTPVLGDSIYGSSSANKKAGITRQLLHAHRMRFIHPITQKPLELTAPLPADMSSLFYKFVD